MHLALLIVALQFRTATLSEAPQRVSGGSAADSARDLSRARSAQVSFERSRRGKNHVVKEQPPTDAKKLVHRLSTEHGHAGCVRQQMTDA